MHFFKFFILRKKMQYLVLIKNTLTTKTNDSLSHKIKTSRDITFQIITLNDFSYVFCMLIYKNRYKISGSNHILINSLLHLHYPINFRRSV